MGISVQDFENIDALDGCDLVGQTIWVVTYQRRQINGAGYVRFETQNMLEVEMAIGRRVLLAKNQLIFRTSSLGDRLIAGANLGKLYTRTRLLRYDDLQ